MMMFFTGFIMISKLALDYIFVSIFTFYAYRNIEIINPSIHVPYQIIELTSNFSCIEKSMNSEHLFRFLLIQFGLHKTLLNTYVS